MEDIDPGSFVANQYGLVRNICQNLPDQSLDSCHEVNALWAKAVDAERKKRKIVLFHWQGEAKNTQVRKFKQFCNVSLEWQFCFQYYSQFGQESENHKSLWKAMEVWKKENVSNCWKPETSLTISIGDPMGGPDNIESFIADPFRVSQILGSRNISIAASGMGIAPVNEPAKVTYSGFPYSFGPFFVIKRCLAHLLIFIISFEKC